MMETKAKTGDLVRIISTEGLDGRFKLGEVVMISDCLLEAYGEEAMYAVAGVYLDGDWDYCLSDSNFEVVDNPQEYEAFVQSAKNGDNIKDKTHKAKKGDLVRVTSTEVLSVNAGEVYEVGEIKPSVSGYMNYEMLGSSPENDDNVFLFGDEFEVIEEESPQQNDAVNHPNHYTQGRFETIEVIEEIAGGYDDGYVAYCVGNAIKYLSRAPHKHATPVEDLRKAATYLDFAIKAETRRAT